MGNLDDPTDLGFTCQHAASVHLKLGRTVLAGEYHFHHPPLQLGRARQPDQDEADRYLHDEPGLLRARLSVGLNFRERNFHELW
jgi:hypothetical protein